MDIDFSKSKEDTEVDVIKAMILKHLKPINFGDEIDVSLILEQSLFDDSNSNEKDVFPFIQNNSLEPLNTADNSNCCHICHKKFSKKQYLERHSLKHTTKFACPVCFKTFSRKAGKEKHVFKCKTKQLISMDKSISNSKRSNSNKSAQKFFCEKCSKSFTRGENYRQHIIKHNGFQLDCHICQKNLSSVKSLQRHLRIHEESKSNITCQYCSANFSLKSNLKRHMKLHENNNLDNLICCKCNKNTKNCHILNKHKNNEPIICLLCSDSFCLEAHLKTHLKVIHHNLWFKCKQCFTNTPFMTKHFTHLQKHVKKHHFFDLQSTECYQDGWYLLS